MKNAALNTRMLRSLYLKLYINRLMALTNAYVLATNRIPDFFKKIQDDDAAACRNTLSLTYAALFASSLWSATCIDAGTHKLRVMPFMSPSGNAWAIANRGIECQ